MSPWISQQLEDTLLLLLGKRKIWSQYVPTSWEISLHELEKCFTKPLVLSHSPSQAADESKESIMKGYQTSNLLFPLQLTQTVKDSTIESMLRDQHTIWGTALYNRIGYAMYPGNVSLWRRILLRVIILKRIKRQVEIKVLGVWSTEGKGKRWRYLRRKIWCGMKTWWNGVSILLILHCSCVRVVTFYGWRKKMVRLHFAPIREVRIQSWLVD